MIIKGQVVAWDDEKGYTAFIERTGIVTQGYSMQHLEKMIIDALLNMFYDYTIEYRVFDITETSFKVEIINGKDDFLLFLKNQRSDISELELL